MKSLRKTSTAAAMALALAMGAARAGEPARIPQEMLVGEYACSTYPDSGPKTQGSLVATTTSGLFVTVTATTPINIVVALEAGGVPTCDDFASDAQARIQTAGGCTASVVGVIEPGPNNSAARRSVQFVCSGQRDKMVDSMARLVELLVTSAR